jgi:hypothetical protein
MIYCGGHNSANLRNKREICQRERERVCVCVCVCVCGLTVNRSFTFFEDKRSFSIKRRWIAVSVSNAIMYMAGYKRQVL